MAGCHPFDLRAHTAHFPRKVHTVTVGGMASGLGIDLPQDVTGTEHGRLLRRFASEADAAGYDSLWVTEASTPEVLEPLAALTYSAAVTERARLGAAVLLTAFRAPLLLARHIATLDRLSQGRAIIGVGLGNDRRQYARFGLAVQDRVSPFESGIRVLRSLLGQEWTTSQEPWWDLDGVRRPLAPLQKPAPPLWFGARAPSALDRAARLGDGWVGAGSSTLPEFATALEFVRRSLEKAGRADTPFAISKRVYLHVLADGDDRSDVVAQVRQWFDHHYGNPSGADRFVVIGSVAECADHVGRLRQKGASTVILHPMIHQLEQLERLTEGVAPQVA